MGFILVRMHCLDVLFKGAEIKIGVLAIINHTSVLLTRPIVDLNVLFKVAFAGKRLGAVIT